MRKIKPMLLKSIKKDELGSINPDEYFVYEKFDGFRAIWDKGQFYGRGLERWDYYFPEIFNELKAKYPACVFDSEIINSKGISKANILQKRLRSNDFHIKVMSGLYDDSIPATLPAKMMIFDILEKDNEDLRQKPFDERQRILRETIKDSSLIEMVMPIEKSPCEAFMELTGQGKEGIVLKKRNSPYIETFNSEKRTEFWLKAKNVVEKVIRFDSYDENPVGITLISENGIRCACNGGKHIKVKEIIDSKGYVFVEVKGLEVTDNNKIRQIVYGRLVE